MSETIREIVSDPKLMEAIIKAAESDPEFKKPIYWDALTEKNGISAMVIAQMLKAMGGDTPAFVALSKYGFGEKVQMEVSDFYRADRIEIEVVKSPQIEEGDEIIEGTIEGDGVGNGELAGTSEQQNVGELEPGDSDISPTNG